MLIKFTSGGRGSGGEVCRYLIDPERPGREGRPPEVVRGDLERTRELIDSIEREWSYTHGVLSFALEDAPTEEQQREAMDAFEAFAFAGLDCEQFDISWVRHQHTEGGRVELHFVTPRMELTSGRALNIAPPGWEGSYATLRDELNLTHSWARPDDPERARERGFEPPWRTAGFRLSEQREAVHDYVASLIEAGGVRGRAEMVLALTEAGLEVTRQGKDYLGLKDPQTGERLRLKGGIYGEDWTYDAELERATGGAARKPDGGDRSDDRRRIEEARQRCAEARGHRARAHRERYPRPEPEDRGDPASVLMDERRRRRNMGVPDRELDADRLLGLALDGPPDAHRNPADLHGRGGAELRGSAVRERDVSLSQPDERSDFDLRGASETGRGMNDGSTDSVRERFTQSLQEIGRRVREISDSVQGAFGRLKEALGSYFQTPDGDRGAAGQDRGEPDPVEQSLDRAERENRALDRASERVTERTTELIQERRAQERVVSRSGGMDRDW